MSLSWESRLATKEKSQNFHKVEKTKQKNDLNCINLYSAATESGEKGQFTKFKPSEGAIIDSSKTAKTGCKFRGDNWELNSLSPFKRTLPVFQ